MKKKNIKNLNNKQSQPLLQKPNQEDQPTPTPKADRSRQMSSKSQLSKRSRLSNRLEDQNQAPEWNKLSTGLQLYINEETVKKWWSCNKIKLSIIEYITKFFEQLKISQNFESLDISIISEFHVFNLIFAKQELYLSDYKTSVFLNLMWTLLISNNEDYGQLTSTQNEYQCDDNNFLKQSENAAKQFAITLEEKKKDDAKRFKMLSQSTAAQLAEQRKKEIEQMEKSLKRKKNVDSDLAAFSFWLRKHSINSGNGNSIQIFEKQEIVKIVEYLQKSYLDNYNLYKYSIIDKRQNDEIRYVLTIDEPLPIPPLSEALFMGHRRLEVEEDEDDNPKCNETNQGQSQASIGKQYDQNEEEQNQIIEDKDAQSTHQEEVQEDPQIVQVKTIADENLGKLKETFSETLNLKNEQLQEQVDDILNPKRKK